MKIKLNSLMMLLFITLSTTIISCGPDSQSSDNQLAAKTEKSISESNKEIGMPAIINFQEKKTLKDIYELRDDGNLICYAYFFNRNEGKIGQFIGKCIGYGIPYSTQYSNPEKVVQSYAGSYGTLPQCEPNGLFMPVESSATWLLLINPKNGKPLPVYIEPDLIVSPFPLDSINSRINK